MQDHPRLRGEHFAKTIDGQCLEGSPPPTRGTQYLIIRQPAQHRITPAYAGNTIDKKPENLLLEDHPRLRGEHLSGYFALRSFQGSPPPTRGTPGEQLLLNFDTRITPAYAGNTQILIVGNYVTPGSPPPTRGTQTVFLFHLFFFGITPAYAGNTYPCFSVHHFYEDHPRLRGEHLVFSYR